ncbi:hypothetical protein BH11ACT1_BH11ACT1_19170 [soil metagenome]
MTSISAPEPTITHPAWCDPAECATEVHRGVLYTVYHRATFGPWRAASGPELEIRLCRADGYNGEDDDATEVEVYAETHDQQMTPDELLDLAAWFTATATSVHAAIATEGGAR